MKFIYWLSLVLFSFIACRPALQKVSVTEKDRIAIDADIQPDEETQKLIQPYKAQLDAKMDKVLTYNPYQLNKKGLNSKLGILVADAMLEEADAINKKLFGEGVDVALTNHGGLRRTFTPGDLTVRSVYELMPFDNEVVVLKISGKDFKEMVNYLRIGKKGHPIAGLSFSMEGEDLNILIKNQAFDIAKSYNVVTTDYLYNGGDGMNFLKNPIEVHPLNIKLRDLFIQNFEKSDTIKLNETPRYN